MGGEVECVSCTRLPRLTVCYLQLGLGHDAASYSQRLADVITCIGALYGRDSELSGDGHRHAAVALRRLVGEQKVLWGEGKWKEKYIKR